MGMDRKKTIIITIIYTVILLGFTTYLALDTFVIPSAGVPVGGGSSIHNSQTPMPTGGIATTPVAAVTPIITDDSYEDDNITITLSTIREYDSNIFVADIRLKSEEYIHSAFANNMYGKNITDYVGNMAKEHNAILAINADYYGAREEGFVIREGVLYRDKAKSNSQEAVVIYEDGNIDIVKEGSVSAADLLSQGAYNVFSFGPGLIKNGEILVSDRSTTKHNRTAIGMYDRLHYIFLVVDGRTDVSEGMSYYELASFGKKLGLNLMYNLDGGGSSVMYFNGKRINNPTSSGSTIKERKVSDIVYIGY